MWKLLIPALLIPAFLHWLLNWWDDNRERIAINRMADRARRNRKPRIS